MPRNRRLALLAGPLAPWAWPMLSGPMPALRMLCWRTLGLLMLAWLLLAGIARAQDVQAVPALSARVVDTIGWLSAAERDTLERKLAAFEAEAGPQIVLLLVASSQPEDIASYAQRVADSWKIGRREVGDGVLLVAARDDRKLRIEVAKALEGAVPDLAARQIISQQIAPAFKRGEVAAGLGAGVDALMARIRGEHLPAPSRQAEQTGQPAAEEGFDWQMLAMFFFVAVPVVGGILTSVMGRKLGSVATAGGAGALAWWLSASLLLAGGAGLVALVLVGLLGVGAGAGRRSAGGVPPIIWGGGGGWAGGGRGGGGGGFSSGGGGDFGGGGASGDW